MKDNYFKKYKKILKIKKHKFKWFFDTVFFILLFIGLLVFMIYFLPNLLLFVLIPMVVVICLILYYRIYILFSSSLYHCNYCGSKFYIKFTKQLLIDFGRLISNRASNPIIVAHRVSEDKVLWWNEIKCPSCKNLILLSECEVDKKMIGNVVLYDVLNRLNINYDEIEHKEVKTIADAITVSCNIVGVGTKSLFLTDKKNYYLVILEENKRADINALMNIIGCSRLSFASSNRLKEVLNLEEGSVTPFGIINDIDNKVMILIDKDLKDNKLLFHPNINTKTISVSYDDLIKFIEDQSHKYFNF